MDYSHNAASLISLSRESGRLKRRFCVIDSFIVQKAGMKVTCTFRNHDESEIPASIGEIGAQCFLNCALSSKVTFSNEGNLKRIGKRCLAA